MGKENVYVWNEQICTKRKMQDAYSAKTARRLYAQFSKSCASEASVRERSRHYRVRNTCRGLGSNCDFGDNHIPSKIGRIVGGYFRWNKQLIASVCGQSSVEYAVVLGAILCIVVVLGALSSVVSDGVFIQHAIAAASHNVQGSVGGAIDVFCF
ncbi:hypothetical protein [Adlercreutzia sp. ZJ154]|uniref:hypothetical protein n=1 Tax=Adlercreutzia sp. ZJ154 TaxID=2709790 RepID=UPI001F14F628|nr:hypothetical protein [Adlercreutzia sp. ZJ154]